MSSIVTLVSTYQSWRTPMLTGARESTIIFHQIQTRQLCRMELVMVRSTVRHTDKVLHRMLSQEQHLLHSLTARLEQAVVLNQLVPVQRRGAFCLMRQQLQVLPLSTNRLRMLNGNKSLSNSSRGSRMLAHNLARNNNKV